MLWLAPGLGDTACVLLGAAAALLWDLPVRGEDKLRGAAIRCAARSLHCTAPLPRTQPAPRAELMVCWTHRRAPLPPPRPPSAMCRAAGSCRVPTDGLGTSADGAGRRAPAVAHAGRVRRASYPLGQSLALHLTNGPFQ